MCNPDKITELSFNLEIAKLTAADERHWANVYANESQKLFEELVVVKQKNLALMSLLAEIRRCLPQKQFMSGNYSDPHIKNVTRLREHLAAARNLLEES